MTRQVVGAGTANGKVIATSDEQFPVWGNVAKLFEMHGIATNVKFFTQSQNSVEFCSSGKSFNIS